MMDLSEVPYNWGRTCKGLLIIASTILSCWIQPVSPQGAPVTVVPKPPYGTVGSNVTLTIQGFSEEALMYTWYRKVSEESHRIATYIHHTGVQSPADIRQKVLPDGSLFISNLTLKDSDLYIVLIVNTNGLIAARAQGQLEVYGDDSLSGGAIAGIGIGILAGVTLIGTLVYFLLIRKTRR